MIFYSDFGGNVYTVQSPSIIVLQLNLAVGSFKRFNRSLSTSGVGSQSLLSTTRTLHVPQVRPPPQFVNLDLPL